MPLSSRPCSIHKARVIGKLASTYNRWWNGDDQWTRVKQRYCADCLMTLLAILKASDSNSDLSVFACSMCGADISTAQNATYVDVFVPKQEGRAYAIATCDSCTKQLRESLLEGAELLPDRGTKTLGASDPQSNPWSDFEW